MTSANPNQFGSALHDDHMAQEEEWEREGLLDPAWEKQQRKVKPKKHKNTTAQSGVDFINCFAP